MVLLIVLHIYCREGAQPLATAVMAQARRNAHGAEAQVRFLCFSSFKLCSLAPHFHCGHRSYDGGRRALLLTRTWLQAVPNMQKQGQATSVLAWCIRI